MKRNELLRGVALGAALGAGYVTQTYGLLTASPSVSGFITGTFVVFTPVVSWVVLRISIDRHTWMGVALALAGVALLGLRGWSLGAGELLTLACAIFFALQIVGLGEWASRETVYGLAFVQIATVAVVCLVIAAPSGLQLPTELPVWGAVVITAVLATALAFFVQTWAQSLLAPTHAAVIMTMEPVFAGIFGVVFGGDSLTLRVAAGFACILAAMLLVQLSQRTLRARNVPG
jgi:drug/metabolite transporter (DMT)-like permease